MTGPSREVSEEAQVLKAPSMAAVLRHSDPSHSLEETWPCRVASTASSFALGSDGGGDRPGWGLLGTSGDGDEEDVSNHLMGQKAKT